MPCASCSYVRAALATDPTRDGLAMPAVPALGAFSPYDPEVRHTPTPEVNIFFVEASSSRVQQIEGNTRNHALCFAAALRTSQRGIIGVSWECHRGVMPKS